MLHQYFQNFYSINSIGNGAANKCTNGSLTLEVSYRANGRKTRDKRGKYDAFIEFCKRFEANRSVLIEIGQSIVLAMAARTHKLQWVHGPLKSDLNNDRRSQ